MAVLSAPGRLYRTGLGRAGSSGIFLVLVGAAPAALALGRLLPAHGPSLALRLAAAAACVLLVPGAIFVRAISAVRAAWLWM